MEKDIAWLMDEAYSVIGGAMTYADNVSDDARGAAIEKAQQLLRLAEELDAMLKGKK